MKNLKLIFNKLKYKFVFFYVYFKYISKNFKFYNFLSNQTLYKFTVFSLKNWKAENVLSDRIVYFNKLKIHRKIGPARIEFGERKIWMNDKTIHRIDGPAITDHPCYPDYEWYFSGKYLFLFGYIS